MTTLYFKDGSSDKVYQADLVEAGGGFNVQFAYGRRGSTLTTGNKNAVPLPKDEAQKVLDKLLREKMAKGYTPGEDGAVYTATTNEERFTGILPMLLNAIDETQMHFYLRNDEWVAQEKYDGVRMMISKTVAGLWAINRKGLIVGAPEAILKAAAKLPGEFILDGECVGETYYAFDLIQLGPLSERLEKLHKLLDHPDHYPIVEVLSQTGTWKRSMLEGLREHNAEGIVFKRVDAEYKAGRPGSGGNALKFKFTVSATCMVHAVNGSKRSVSLDMWNGSGERYEVGNVTIPANHEIPAPNQIVEVRYLYAFPGGSLFQPVYLGPRDDVEADDISTLKYKAGTEDDEA